MLGLCFLLVGFNLYVGQLVPQQLSLPLAPLVLDPMLSPSDALPLSRGALAGQSVLLVTIDTARPDRLGFYGNSDIATPNLDRLARTSSVFTRALATTPITLPSHASILTGQYPHHHGVRLNGLPPLAPEQKTLAEHLSQQGYDTAAFVSSFILEAQFGLAQGFSRYDDQTAEESSAKGYAERRADETTDRALSWLRRARENPFFLWVHYYDPHADYAPPEFFERTSANAYDGELAFIDQQIGRLIGGVTSSIKGDALVIVTADHGEGLGEHGEQSHGLLVHNATIKIPLIIGAVGRPPLPARIDGLVSQVDLMPTVLSLLGLAVPEDIDGRDLTEPLEPDRMVLAESHYADAIYGWARLAAIYRNDFKYVDGPNPEFYDLAADPAEQHNLFSVRKEETDDFLRQLTELRGPAADGLGSSVWELDLDSTDRLESLGYVVSGYHPGAHRGGEAPDPKRMLPKLTQMLVLLTGLERRAKAPGWTRTIVQALRRPLPRDETELLVALEEFAREEPDFSPVHRELASLYEKAGRPRDALESRRRFESLSDRKFKSPHESEKIHHVN